MSERSPLIARTVTELNPRRAFLKQTGLISLTAVAMGLVSVKPGWAMPKAGPSPENDVTVLNTALALEYEGIAAYQVGAESGLLKKPVLAVAVQFQGQHKAHARLLAQTITKLGGTPVEPKRPAEYGFPVDQLKTQADVLQFAAGLEKGAASAYLVSVPLFYNRDLSKAAASILGDETMHWAVLRNVLGQDPVPMAFVS